MMDLLDAHADICSSGERDFPTNGFARESLIPGRWDLGIEDCSLKRGCMWSFVAQYVPLYVRNYFEWCPAAASDAAVASGEGVSLVRASANPNPNPNPNPDQVQRVRGESRAPAWLHGPAGAAPRHQP